jgi:hypothetical protein
MKPLPLLLIGVIAAALIANVIATYNLLTLPHPGHNDFMSRWEGARSYWIDGLNPYGDQASLNIQMAIYGRPVVEGEDPGYFAYPFYTVLLIAPLVTLNYAWAAAIWMVLLEVCLIGALLLMLNLLRWRPPPLLFGVLMLWALLDYFASRGLILGQPGVLVYFLEIAALWAFYRERPILGGVVLAISTLKPQMGFLIVPFLLLWALRTQRWRFLAAFTITFGLLFIVSFLMTPTWLGDWLRQVSNYGSYTALGSPVWIVSETLRYYTGAGAWLEGLLNLIFYGVMLWAWYGVLVRQQHERFLWAAALTLTVTHLVAPRTATPHYVVFTLPLLFYFQQIVRLNRRRGLWIVFGLLLTMFILTWVHQLTTVVNRFEHPTLYLPLPFGMFALLIVLRRLWWAHAPAPKPATPRPVLQPAGENA